MSKIKQELSSMETVQENWLWAKAKSLLESKVLTLSW